MGFREGARNFNTYVRPLSAGSISVKLSRGVAQLASAPALGAGGPGFESRLPDQDTKAHL